MADLGCDDDDANQHRSAIRDEQLQEVVQVWEPSTCSFRYPSGWYVQLVDTTGRQKWIACTGTSSSTDERGTGAGGNMRAMWRVVEARCRCWFSLNVVAADVEKRSAAERHASTSNNKPYECEHCHPES